MCILCRFFTQAHLLYFFNVWSIHARHCQLHLTFARLHTCTTAFSTRKFSTMVYWFRCRFFRLEKKNAKGAITTDTAIKINTTGDYIYLELRNASGQVLEDIDFLGLSTDLSEAAPQKTTYDTSMNGCFSFLILYCELYFFTHAFTLCLSVAQMTRRLALFCIPSGYR